MKILVINCGSSSLKFQLFNENDGSLSRLISIIVEKIGSKINFVTLKFQDNETRLGADNLNNHSAAIEFSLDILCDKKYGIIESYEDIDAIGHRVVHGGEIYSNPVLINEKVKGNIKNYCQLAPLHNPINLEGINTILKLLPGKPNIAVFDTSFHQTIKPYAYIYAIPYEYYKKYNIRKYGFHGTSCKYVFEQAAVILNQRSENLKAIICHLGNGTSITAVDGGKVVDTSMGFTPLEGLIMGTRSGDIDPGAAFFIGKQENLDFEQLEDILNKKSGLLGLSNISNDMRDILDKYETDDPLAKLTVQAYVYRILKYIGAFTASLNGVDVIIFTAGIGEKSPTIRRLIIEKLGFLGVNLAESRNKKTIAKMDLISTLQSKVKALVIPTDEELMIAKETLKVLQTESSG